MKLIGSLTSPYVRKVRIMLAEKKIEAKWEELSPWVPDSPVARVNPLGKVPVLVLDDGEALFDSRVIVEYLDTLTPVGKLIPAAGRERAEVRTWEALADGVMDAAATARLEQTWEGRSPSQRCPAWIARQLDKVHAGIKAMSAGLGDKPYCCGTHLSLADIAVGAALGYVAFRFPDIAWREQYPNLAKLYDKLMQRPSFRDTAPPQS